jgi:hypothetical protein
MMTKKTFVEAARIIKAIQDRDDENRGEAQRVADAFARLFVADNPRFDRGRFLAACGL